MYSILPIVVAVLFLGYGLYVVLEKGFNRVTTSFFLLCFSTFCWQATWAVLFKIKDPETSIYLIKFGYLLILVLPTSLYHFLAEISKSKNDRYGVIASYLVVLVFAIILLSSDYFISGYYEYFFGYYPKAGLLHPFHVLQTVIVVGRGLYITYKKQKSANADTKSRLRLCLISILIYFFAAIDYLCNYGIEFYPPGVIFTCISLGLIAYAVVKYELMNPVAIATSVAHEIRTPLSTIRLQAEILDRVFPDLLKGYQLAVANNLCEDKVGPVMANKLHQLSTKICHQIDRSNVVIDMLLAAGKMEHKIDAGSFAEHSIVDCIFEAIDSYPFIDGDRSKVNYEDLKDFIFFGSDNLLIFVIFNLLKNSLHAIRVAEKGNISISTNIGIKYNSLIFTDSGSGIPENVVPRIFDRFFSTNKINGTGIGLTFCKHVMKTSGGRMTCESEFGRYTTFTLDFPKLMPN